MSDFDSREDAACPHCGEHHVEERDFEIHSFGGQSLGVRDPDFSSVQDSSSSSETFPTGRGAQTITARRMTQGTHYDEGAAGSGGYIASLGESADSDSVSSPSSGRPISLQTMDGVDDCPGPLVLARCLLKAME